MADYKVRNGDAFEKMIMDKQRENPKFSFLFDTSSPAHAYYHMKIVQLQAVLQASGSIAQAARIKEAQAKLYLL